MKQKKNELIISFGLILFALMYLSVEYVYSESMEKISGYIICIEKGKKGIINTKVDFEECNGLLAIFDREEKIYTISGPEKTMTKLEKGSKRRMGELVDQTLRGKIVGSERSLHIIVNPNKYQSNNIYIDDKKGKIYCLFPDYREISLKYVVSDKPCDKMKAHAHAIFTEDGEIIAIIGDEEYIKEIESSSNRQGVLIKGEIKGNNEGKVIYLNQ